VSRLVSCRWFLLRGLVVVAGEELPFVAAAGQEDEAVQVVAQNADELGGHRVVSRASRCGIIPLTLTA
jgi:hypothetical protein